MSGGRRTPERLPPTPGACDCHAHVFGPLDRFPPRVETAYQPPDAPAPRHRAMLSALGLERGVLVQPALYGSDNAALVEALSDNRLAGVASVGADASVGALETLRVSGIRALRFVEARDPMGGRYRGTVGFEALQTLAPAMRTAGLHAELWAPAEQIIQHSAMLQQVKVPVVLDHLGGMDAERGPDDRVNRLLVAMVADLGLWVKLTIARVSRQGPDYADVRPLHDALIAAAPSRAVWGSDWPHVRMGDRAPVTRRLLDLFDEWIGHDEALRTRILVDNPARLYGF